MSGYEDYTRKSANYDKTREPVGTEILVGCFAHAPVPLDRTVVLDAGCGTGSYSDALPGYVGRTEAVDLNPGMLEVAARKPAWAGDRVSFHRSPLWYNARGQGSGRRRSVGLYGVSPCDLGG